MVVLSLVLFRVVVTSLVDHEGVLALTRALDEVGLSDLAGRIRWQRSRYLCLHCLSFPGSCMQSCCLMLQVCAPATSNWEGVVFMFVAQPMFGQVAAQWNRTYIS